MNADPIIDSKARRTRDSRSIAARLAIFALLVVFPLGLALVAQQPPASGAPTAGRGEERRGHSGYQRARAPEVRRLPSR